MTSIDPNNTTIHVRAYFGAMGVTDEKEVVALEDFFGVKCSLRDVLEMFELAKADGVDAAMYHELLVATVGYTARYSYVHRVVDVLVRLEFPEFTACIITDPLE